MTSKMLDLYTEGYTEGQLAYQDGDSTPWQEGAEYRQGFADGYHDADIADCQYDAGFNAGHAARSFGHTAPTAEGASASDFALGFYHGYHTGVDNAPAP